jgi:hypothetical protein
MCLLEIQTRQATEFTRGAAGKGRDKLNPSGYMEARAPSHRGSPLCGRGSGWPVGSDFGQTDFSEPMIPINTDNPERHVGGSDKSAAGTRLRKVVGREGSSRMLKKSVVHGTFKNESKRDQS